MKRSDFHFDLPPELIAQHPATERDGARLLVVDAATGARSHRTIRDLPELLPAGSLCVPNDVRVRHARLFLGAAVAVPARPCCCAASAEAPSRPW